MAAGVAIGKPQAAGRGRDAWRLRRLFSHSNLGVNRKAHLPEERAAVVAQVLSVVLGEQAAVVAQVLSAGPGGQAAAAQVPSAAPAAVALVPSVPAAAAQVLTAVPAAADLVPSVPAAAAQVPSAVPAAAVQVLSAEAAVCRRHRRTGPHRQRKQAASVQQLEPLRGAAAVRPVSCCCPPHRRCPRQRQPRLRCAAFHPSFACAEWWPGSRRSVRRSRRSQRHCLETINSRRCLS